MSDKAQHSRFWPIHVVVVAFALLYISSPCSAQVSLEAIASDEPPRPPTNVHAEDTPDDDGESITVTWTLSPDDQSGEKDIVQYQLVRSDSRDGHYDVVKTAPKGTTQVRDQQSVEDGKDYYYKVIARDASQWAESDPFGPVQSRTQWFNLGRLNTLILMLIYTTLLLYFIFHAKKGKELFIRRLAGLDALDEAVGRATEMGRPILYVPGLTTLSDVATIASVNILSGVSRTVAEYESRVIVPCYDPVVMTVAQEVVREGFMAAGKPDSYNEQDVFYVSSSQFAYVAAVDGIMVREKPATNLFMGMFFAESLILAETGAMTGAIQIAGTDAVAQLPFFIAACDYTIIGEELYAASAYLSRAPLLLGSLKGQDWMKMIFVCSIIVGVLLLLFGVPDFQMAFETPLPFFR